MREGVSTFARFDGGAEGTRWYCAELLREFERVMPGQLCQRFQWAVKGFY